MPDPAPAAATAPSSEHEPARAEGRAPRLDGVDLLRGSVMVLMALDHVRDFFSDPFAFSATDLTKTNAALFMTRWITHFCAPVFVLLAGTAAYLQGTRGQEPGALARRLFIRGLWLVLLDLTVVRILWTFEPTYRMTWAGVIWAIGWGMIVLAGLVRARVPPLAAGAAGAAMIAAHNLFDGISPEHFGSMSWLWIAAHAPRPVTIAPGHVVFFLYSLVPWIGVLLAGYGFGAVLGGDPSARRRRLIALGAALTAAFVALRAANVYGDPGPWAAQKSALFTVFSFVNCAKYPPSLLFLLMTLGPAILLLGWLEGRDLARARPLVVFGRVPLFYYLLHLLVIHLAACAAQYVRYGQVFPEYGPDADLPAGYGFGLPVIHAVWLAVVALLYPACRWFAAVKRRRREAWLTYL